MDEILNSTKLKLESSIKLLKEKLSSINATGAHPSMFRNINVEYYEVMTPLPQLANIKVVDATMLTILPYDKKIIKDIVSAIHKLNIDFNPIDEGDSIRVTVPVLTSEKRGIFAKEVKEIGEEIRISVRNVRQDSNKKIRNNENFSENEKHLAEEKIQELINEYNSKIEEIVKIKIDILLNI